MDHPPPRKRKSVIEDHTSKLRPTDLQIFLPIVFLYTELKTFPFAYGNDGDENSVDNESIYMYDHINKDKADIQIEYENGDE